MKEFMVVLLSLVVFLLILRGLSNYKKPRNKKSGKWRQTMINLKSIETTNPKHAREIMGKNFFGIEEAIRYFGVNPTPEQLAVLEKIPFTEIQLEEMKDSHILVAGFPISILEIRDKVDWKLFHSHEDSWYNEDSFAKERGGDMALWWLMSKMIKKKAYNVAKCEASFLRNKGRDEIPDVRWVVYTIIGYYLNTGERLVEDSALIASSRQGIQVNVNFFDLEGLHISEFWNPKKIVPDIWDIPESF